MRFVLYFILFFIPFFQLDYRARAGQRTRQSQGQGKSRMRFVLFFILFFIPNSTRLNRELEIPARTKNTTKPGIKQMPHALRLVLYLVLYPGLPVGLPARAG